MQKRAPFSAVLESAIPTEMLARYGDGWLLAGDIAQHSRRTLGNRRDLLTKLLWFLKSRNHDTCGLHELRLFFHYLSHGHEDDGGRWGNPQCGRAMKPRSIHTDHGHLQTLFTWIVSEGGIDASPMDRIPPPTAREDQILPFTESQVDAIIRAARKSASARRDEAVVLFLLDTGVRASELCGLTRADLDIEGRLCQVVGKGNKRRPVPFGKVCARALWSLTRDSEPGHDEPVFASCRGKTSGAAMTRSGLRQLIDKLGREAGVQGVRCSPHTFRHTFAIQFLRAGGNVFTLQALLGHESIDMTRRYVRIAQADIREQHRQFSPADRLFCGRAGGRTRT